MAKGRGCWISYSRFILSLERLQVENVKLFTCQTFKYTLSLCNGFHNDEGARQFTLV